ncbi:MAG: hypothetical protein J6Y71_02710, partial [Ruminococcus sp.]|nr:hypothetical protein [Ruminococcus sp.]
MAAEYLANAEQLVSLNSPINFEASIPCRKGYVIHEDGTGIFILRGITDQCYATYQVTYNGNIALPEEAEDVVPIAIAITVNGEPRLTSRAIYTPAAVDEFGNVTSTAIIRIPRGCCFTVAVEAVPATTDPTVTPAPVINTQNNNLVINRIA